MRPLGKYYSGGFAEIVSEPSEITYSYFSQWFTGSASLGRAMKLIGMPYQELDVPVLELIDGKLLVNLVAEEKTLYKNTIFKYKEQANVNAVPRLIVDLSKLFNPFCILGVIRIVMVQSAWIANPGSAVGKAKKLVLAIPQQKFGETAEEVSKLLAEQVWPNVIAVGVLTEFYNQYLMREAGEEFPNTTEYISAGLALNDWFFLSIADMQKVKTGEISFEDYISEYGIRADRDYELTSPRWYEMENEIQKRISGMEIAQPIRQKRVKLSGRIKKITDAFIDLQLLRTEAKRRALIHIDELREKSVGVKKQKLRISKKKKRNATNSVKKGKGMGASVGKVDGVAKNILNGNEKIEPGTIGIFPNASPEFTLLYPKCTGIIFLTGGQTSHGVIVAREFGVPALIDSRAGAIPDGTGIAMDGISGEWVLF